MEGVISIENDIQKEIMQCIQQAYKHYQRPFTITEYKDLAKDKNLVGYDYALYHSRKTWRELLQIARVPTVRPGPKSKPYTRDDVIDSILKAAKSQGSFPTFTEYLTIAKEHDLPGRKTVFKHGAWAELRKEAESKILKDT